MKKIRKKIQNDNNLDTIQLAHLMGISQSSIFRVEDIAKFKSSIFIKYLLALRKYNIDVNEVLDNINLTNKEKESP